MTVFIVSDTKSSVREKVVERDDGLNTPGMGVVDETAGRHHREMHGLPQAVHAGERRDFPSKRRLVGFVDDEGVP